MLSDVWDDCKNKSFVSVFIVMAIASCLRLYRLDTPSMWLDEILVPMAAAYPVEYIFDLCRNVEVHPPGYYLLVKGILGFGVSDFALRIVSSLAGIFSVYLTYLWVKELSGEPEGIFAAAFLAVNPLHIYDSRVVRPYSVFLAVLLLGLLFLFRFLRNGAKKDLFYFSLANALLILIHYAALMFTAAAGLLLSAIWFFRRRSMTLKCFLSFPAATAGAVLLVLPFIMGRVEKTHKSQFMGFDFLSATANTVNKLSEVVYMNKDWLLRGLLVLFVLAGLVRLLRRHGTQGMAVAWLTISPVGMLIATKYDYYAYNVWHLSFLLPLLACMAGHSLGFLRPKVATVSAVVFALACGGYFALHYHDDYFEKNSAILPFFILGKPAARDMAGLVVPGDIVSVTDFSIFNSLNWYIDQFATVNPLKEQSLPLGSKSVNIKYISGLGQFGGLAKNEEEFLSKMGRPLSIKELGQLKIYTFEVEREPGLAIKSLPGMAVVSAGLKEFYSRADRLENLTYDGNWGGAFSPTAPGKKAEVAFHVDNTAEHEPQLVTVGARYTNQGRGNTLRVFYRFNEEPERQAMMSLGHDDSAMDIAIVERVEPYSRIAVRCEMELAPLTARFPGGNQETLGLREIFVRTEALR